jgi:hypothetical protein
MRTVITCALVLIAPSVRAQTLTFVDPREGDCEVTLSYQNVNPGTSVGFQHEFHYYPVAAAARNSSGEATVRLEAPLQSEDRLWGNVNRTAFGETPVPARTGDTRAPKGRCLRSDSPKRDVPLFAWAFFGESVDTFSADSVQRYAGANKDATSSQKTQKIFGIDFEYRLTRHIVLSGESLHAVRTADIDCADEQIKATKVCADNPAAGGTGAARFILENASSLEIFVNPRFEFRPGAPVTPYFTARGGVTLIRGLPETQKTTTAGLGLFVNEPVFYGSFGEITYGRNQLLSGGWNRLRGDALLSFRIPRVPWITDNMRLFIEGVFDEGPRGAATSYRTFFGVDLDLRTMSK